MIEKPVDVPVTWREWLIRDVWNEVKKTGETLPPIIYDGPIEVRHKKLKEKLENYRQKIEKIRAEMQSKAESDKLLIATTPKEEPPTTATVKPKSEEVVGSEQKEELKEEQPMFDYEDIGMNENITEFDFMTPEEILQFKAKEERIEKEKEEIQKKKDDYERMLKELTLKDFTDRPDQIDTIECYRAKSDSFSVDWLAPKDNNSPITSYNVYLSTKTISCDRTQLFSQQEIKSKNHQFTLVHTIEDISKRRFTFTGLDPDTCYFIRVTAVNDKGEGYQADPFMVRTAAARPLCNVYVWGSNLNSELGLSDQIIEENKDIFSNYSIKKPILNSYFN